MYISCAVQSCGDGNVVGSEECDDGNSDEQDGCFSTCEIDEDFVCGAATPVFAGVPVVGDTSTGTHGFTADCAGGGREVLFVYTPTASGAATISLSGPLNIVLAVRAECTEPSSELGCAAGSWGPGELLVNIEAEAGVPVTIFVDSTSMNFAGPFELLVTQL